MSTTETFIKRLKRTTAIDTQTVLNYLSTQQGRMQYLEQRDKELNELHKAIQALIEAGGKPDELRGYLPQWMGGRK
jgi:LPS O-antigen subunit length determinant protein (WzzB/FepE family)